MPSIEALSEGLQAAVHLCFSPHLRKGHLEMVVHEPYDAHPNLYQLVMHCVPKSTACHTPILLQSQLKIIGRASPIDLVGDLVFEGHQGVLSFKAVHIVTYQLDQTIANLMELFV